MIPQSLRTVGIGAAIIGGGFIALNVTSSIGITVLRSVNERQRKKVSAPCVACQGKCVYICKLCQGNATIPWSPNDLVSSQMPIICPTCEGKRVQLCLNCIGMGYS